MICFYCHPIPQFMDLVCFEGARCIQRGCTERKGGIYIYRERDVLLGEDDGEDFASVQRDERRKFDERARMKIAVATGVVAICSG